MRDRNIQIAVAVEVGDGQAPALMRLCEVGLGRKASTLEPAAVIFQKQRELPTGGRNRKLNDVPVGDDHIQVAVGIEVFASRAKSNEQSPQIRNPQALADVQE